MYALGRSITMWKGSSSVRVCGERELTFALHLAPFKFSEGTIFILEQSLVGFWL